MSDWANQHPFLPFVVALAVVAVIVGVNVAARLAVTLPIRYYAWRERRKHPMRVVTADKAPEAEDEEQPPVMRRQVFQHLEESQQRLDASLQQQLDAINRMQEAIGGRSSPDRGATWSYATVTTRLNTTPDGRETREQVSREVQRDGKEVPMLSHEEEARFRQGICPDCTYECLARGPSGGGSQNYLCQHCGSKFNEMGPFGIERISEPSPNNNLKVPTRWERLRNDKGEL